MKHNQISFPVVCFPFQNVFFSEAMYEIPKRYAEIALVFYFTFRNVHRAQPL